MAGDQSTPPSIRRIYAWALAALGVSQTTGNDQITIGPVYGYILLKAPQVTNVQVFRELERLHHTPTLGIMEAGVVQGDYDAVIKVTAPDHERLHDFVMNDIQGLSWVELTRTFIAINKPRYFHWMRKVVADDEANRRNLATSWVLIRVPALQSGGVVICAEDIPTVTEATAVYGEADVIIKIQGLTEVEQDSTMSQVRKIPYISSTQTYRVITRMEDYHFSRHAEFAWDRHLLI